MRMKVRISLDGQTAAVIEEVAKQCGLTVNEYCRRAVVIYTAQGIEQGKREAEEEHARVGNDVSSGDGETVRAGTSADSHALADQTNP